MQSSAAVAGRALIMLACVVGIPALALSGTSWSEMLKKLQDFQWPEVLEMVSASTSATSDQAPRFVPSKTSAAPDADRAPARLAQAGVASPLCQMSATAVGPQGQPAAPMPAAVVPAEYQVPAELAAMSPLTANAPKNATDASSFTADPFRSIQDRLRQLGATYYLLESWGSHQQLYRFYCKVAVGGSTDYTHCFEATNADPLQAMLQVLRQVETWKGDVGQTSKGEEVAMRR